MIKKLQFIAGLGEGDVYNIDVLREPTEEEAEAINTGIQDYMENYEQQNGDFYGVDLYGTIYDIVRKHVPLAEFRVVKTFYL